MQGKLNFTLTDLKSVLFLPFIPSSTSSEGEQAGFSAFTPWGRGKKAEKPGWILIC
jgi:hypothetical protein